MKIPAVKYMRDFYPEEMRERLCVEDAWRRVSELAGFEPWDAPILEHLDLYRRKSGDEIVSQLYTLTDKGERELAIRPEMTPSLARMIAARQASMPRPIKWYCIARMCRYERGQRGRLREFFQWNIDVLGVAGPVADAEVISVALDGLAAFGLTQDDVEVRLNSRSFLAALLRAIEIPEDKHPAVYAAADKRGKIPGEALDEMYRQIGLSDRSLGRLKALMQSQSLADVEATIAAENITGCENELGELRRLMDYLAALGKGDFCRYDIGIVRGLAYYTGPVFEVFDKAATLRALCGGGRYDRLMETMGGQAMPACGFGMGDVVLGELLKEKKKRLAAQAPLDCQVIALDDAHLVAAMQATQKLRARGKRTDFVMKPGNLGKAMKRAGEIGVATVVLVGGSEYAAGKLKLRDMHTGAETEIPIADL